MTANVYSLTFDQFKRRAQQGNLIPLCKEIPADLETPVSAFLKIRTGKNDFLLESVVGGEKWGRYSFLGSDPIAVFSSRGKEAVLIRNGKRKRISFKKDPLEALKSCLAAFRPVDDPSLPRFSGGAVGFLSYDMVRHFERLPELSTDDHDAPDCYFMIADSVLIFDNVRQKILIVLNVLIDEKKPLKKVYEAAGRRMEAIIKKLGRPVRVGKKTKRAVSVASPLRPSHTEAEFKGLVERAKKYIVAGDIFQVVLSMRFEGEVTTDPFELYRSIRGIDPSPYLYFLQCGDRVIVGASPETMVRLEGSRVELRPIAGTRKRGKNPRDDIRLETELRGDPKERAEHIMLVDLGRNDLGRVCKAGSVKPEEIFVVERYARVMHLVSDLAGELKEGLDAYDVLRATFPAGTLSGAPKIRAMEIIEELERKRRGVYGGCVGYIGFSGNLDTAIAIRTAVVRKKKLSLQAGAGIVYNSIPELEYKECLNKARAMMNALESMSVCP